MLVFWFCKMLEVWICEDEAGNELDHDQCLIYLLYPKLTSKSKPDRRNTMAATTPRATVRKKTEKTVTSVTLVPVKETKNKIVFGPEDQDPNAPFVGVYADKTWAQGVASITITANK